MAEILKRYTLPLITLIILLIALLVYVLVVREEVQAAISGNPSAWMHALLDTLYPRFEVERHRFNAAFFLKKADLIVYRGSLVMMLLSFLPALWKRPDTKDKLNAFLLAPSSKRTFLEVTTVLIFMQVLVVYEFYTSLPDRLPLAEFYQPHWINKLLDARYPSELTIHFLCLCWMISIFLFVFRKLQVVSAVLSLFFFIWMQGYYFGFEKTDHSFYTLFLVLLLLPFYYYENNKTFVEQSWSLRWMQILIALVYALSVLEKLSISGLQWLDPYNLQVHLLQHQKQAGVWIAQFDFHCSLLLFASVLIQASFVVGLFKRDWMKWICLGGFLFHMSTYFLMDIGHWFNPWFVVYVVFISGQSSVVSRQ